MAAAFTESQLAMARHLRDPLGEPAPAGVEDRRLKIYRELIFNNIESFISGGFPVLRSLYSDNDWQQLVTAFVQQHSCHTPYFLEISQEFLQFLMQEYTPTQQDPVFMTELAHYEWVELALDTAEEELPVFSPCADIGKAVLRLSPLAWLLSYQYPVHRIGPNFQPTSAGSPTYLLVYRDHADTVQFTELNAATARMLELVRTNTHATANELLHQLAEELRLEPATVLSFGCDQLVDLYTRGALVLGSDNISSSEIASLSPDR